MARFVPPEVLDEIRSKADIVEIISEYVSLRRQGKNYVGLCPFHLEDTPSFSVSPDKQIFYCFGCQKGGNIINFIMEQDNLTLPEAAGKLAEKVGVAIPETDRDPEDAARHSLLRRLGEMQEQAADFFQGNLLDPRIGREARAYLERRQVTRNMIVDFQLGFAQDGWDSLKQHLAGRGYSEPEMEKAGLAVLSQKGTYYDRFRNRLMFPILDYRGKVVGFGGRVMGSELPKYLNSPETPIFSKSQNLYGIHLAASSIRQADEAVIMEGYMDVIAARQYGINNAVATLGTALTSDQGRLLKRYSANVLISYDADTAGVKAASRGLEVLHQQGMRVRVISLPNGKDPDEFLHRYNLSAWQQLVQNKALSYLEHKIQAAAANYNLTTIEGKADLVAAVLPDIAKIRSQVEKDQYVTRLARMLEIPENTIYADLRRLPGQGIAGEIFSKKQRWQSPRESGGERQAAGKKDAMELAQYNLCRLMIENRQIFDQVEKAIGLDFPEESRLAEMLLLVRENYGDFDWVPATLINRTDRPELKQFMAEFFIADVPCESKDQLVRDYLRLIKMRQLQKRIQEIQAQLNIEGAGQVNKDIKMLLKEFSELQQQVQELKK